MGAFGSTSTAGGSTTVPTFNQKKQINQTLTVGQNGPFDVGTTGTKNAIVEAMEDRWSEAIYD